MDSTMGIRPWIQEEGSPTRQLVHEPECIKTAPKHSMLQHVGQRLQRFLGRHEPCEVALPPSPSPERNADQQPPLRRTGSPSCSPRRVDVLGLPRMGTLRRQNSEKRDRLEPVDQSSRGRRAVSAVRQRAPSAARPRSRSSPPQNNHAPESAPNVTESNDSSSGPQGGSDFSPLAEPNTPTSLVDDFDHEYPIFPTSRSRSSSAGSFERFRDGDARIQLEAELDSKWILNLSMHFRDRSDREKFFVTYAETPTRWRRVTISCDYRNAEAGSLEMDLRELQYQRDKSIQIYESIRDSLPEIQFYNTVTNLKLETSEGRLHVHVTEDTNEIIPYPPKTSVEHILEDEVFQPLEVRESELAFDSHISGFVYKVRYGGRDYIKKEIPGPDTVDEFLYEINALHALAGSESVIQLEAIVVDDQRETVKGLLISLAEQGALVDLLYDHKGEIPWADRVRWAQQAVQGLSEIHEEGYVQGDFTLSNIVVDSENNAKIIDINRRGCPVGWEPPEIAKKIQSNQRISMYIGEKSDIYQLGMTLWALAMDDDEPERHDLPLSTEHFPLHVPRWYSDIVDICLQEKPRDRLSAKELLKRFPAPPAPLTRPTLPTRSSTARAVDKRYIEPSAAVEREDIERLGFSRPRHTEDDFTSHDSIVDPVFTDARSSSYQFDSGSSYLGVTRGRRPASNVAHLETSHPSHQDSGLGDMNMPETCNFEPQIIPVSPNFDREYDEIDLDGNPYLVSRQSFDLEELDILGGKAPGRRRSVQDTLSKLEPILQETGESSSAKHSDYHARNEDNEQEIELEPDHIQAERLPLGESSITSGSTPRNNSSILASSAAYALSSQPPSIVTADLAGFGGHPSLDEHSPHEPKAIPASQFMAENDSLQDQSALPAQRLSQICEDSNAISEHVPVHNLPSTEKESDMMSQSVTPGEPHMQNPEPEDESVRILDTTPVMPEYIQDPEPGDESVRILDTTPAITECKQDPEPEDESVRILDTTPAMAEYKQDPEPEDESVRILDTAPAMAEYKQDPEPGDDSTKVLDPTPAMPEYMQDSQPGDESTKILDTTPAVPEPQHVENSADKQHDNGISNTVTTVTDGQAITPATEESVYHEVPTTQSSMVQPTDQPMTEEIETQPQ